MIIWIDEHIAPAISKFISSTFKITCYHISEVIGNQATDEEIFAAARKVYAVIITKDSDFYHLHSEHGPPPKIIHLQCGNITNADLKDLLHKKLMSSIAEVINNDYTVLK